MPSTPGTWPLSELKLYQRFLHRGPTCDVPKVLPHNAFYSLKGQRHNVGVCIALPHPPTHSLMLPLSTQ